ncbi:purine-cytosine permease family protein [Rhodococcus sp. NPDC056960]|uniref:purine-cytosine permease family protein n=1 Tax=Rhodococcus sp. NPDC056960 TaxID=3345982 RepID=UPI003639B63A
MSEHDITAPTTGNKSTPTETEVPESQRAPRWSLTMAWWAMFSAMFWLYIASASSDAVGVPNTLIGMTLTIATYGIVNRILSRYAARTGLSVESFSRRMFGPIGSILAPLVFAATALYYGVFEGSIVAVALQDYFGGDLRIWYLVCVIYMIPLVLGGVATWLDKINGILLPFYVIGLVGVIAAATVKQGYPHQWLDSVPTTGPLPGWLTSYLIYMGVWVMMMYTFDYARLAKPRDSAFHGTVTFGWVFYLFTFGVNGLIGIYILECWGIAGSESGVVQAIINSLGVAGVVLILISQTRINTANYYLASSNLQVLADRTLRITSPRAVWVLVAGILAYLFMLTDVLSYLLKALAWQGVLVTAWVAIALVHIAMHRRDRAASARNVAGAGAMAWLLASAIGIAATVQTTYAELAQLAPIITVAFAASLYWLSCSRMVRTPISRQGRKDDRVKPSPEEAQTV